MNDLFCEHKTKEKPFPYYSKDNWTIVYCEKCKHIFYIKDELGLRHDPPRGMSIFE